MEDKNKWIQEKLQEAETAASEGDQKLYTLTLTPVRQARWARGY